jgi:hypothetical protein
MKSYQLIAHSKTNTYDVVSVMDDKNKAEEKNDDIDADMILSGLQIETEEKVAAKDDYSKVAVPTMDRPTLGEAVFFGELQSRLASRFTYKSPMPSEEAIDALGKKHLNQWTKVVGATESGKKSPAYRLNHNFFGAVQKEKLCHVRQCEHPQCRLNPHGSTLAKTANASVSTQILNYLKQHHLDKTKPLHYLGFASGQLLRDLEIIKNIIEAGYKNLVLYFLDPVYAKLIESLFKPLSLRAHLDIESEMEIALHHKAIEEFSSWIAAHVDDKQKQAIKIHLFSNRDDASSYFKKSNEKLTLLVGQDFFTREGMRDENFKTPEAHDDFMHLAKLALADNDKGRFFELIKNDTENKIYLHSGRLKQDKYEPTFTSVFDPRANKMTFYPYTSLTFFEPISCHDKSEKCAATTAGFEEYDENGKCVKRYQP